MANVFKKEILSSYKTLIRLSRRMPTKNRRDWMEEKVKEEFRRDPHLKDVNEVQHRLSLAKTQIDNADVMVRHLTRWLGNDQDPDPLDEFGPSSPNSELDSHNYDWELEIDTWRITHPRHCEIHEAGTLQAIDLWNKMKDIPQPQSPGCSYVFILSWMGSLSHMESLCSENKNYQLPSSNSHLLTRTMGKSEDVIKRVEDAKGDWFKILDLDIEKATINDVKKAFRAIAIAIHPDKCKLKGAQEAFAAADQAYKNLKDEDILNKFKRAHNNGNTPVDVLPKRETTLDKAYRADKERRGEKVTPGYNPSMEEELSPEEREKERKRRQQAEDYARMERQQNERDARLAKKRRQKEDDAVDEEELHNTRSAWTSFKSNKKGFAKLPTMKRNIGSTRNSGNPQAEPTMDYQQHRKSWQDTSR